MAINHPRTSEERIRTVAHRTRTLWMSEPHVAPHQRHELMVRLTALELHIEQLGLATTNTTATTDIDLDLDTCESELRDLTNRWGTDAVSHQEVAA